MKQLLSSASLIIFISLLSCNDNREPRQKMAATDSGDTAKKVTDTSKVVTHDMHTSANSLDWKGTYKGVLPCADCPGIETSVTLDSGNTYAIRTKYLGKATNKFEDHGNFVWNEAGNTITLIGVKDKVKKFFVSEGFLTQLDSAGNKIPGNFADKYILTKISVVKALADSSNAELAETYWRLTELMGKPVEAVAQGKKEVHIILKQEDNRIQGFAGCNTINGEYELKPGNRIRFSKVTATLMACPDMNIENQLKKVIERADNYAIKGNMLSLNKARMAPLARFEAVNQR